MSIVMNIVSEFDSSGIKRAQKEFSQLETTGQKAQFAIKKAAVPAAAAIAGLGVALFDATKGAMEDAAAQDLLANSLKKTSGATDTQIKGVENWITQQGKLLGYTDNQLRPAFGRLAKATGDVTKAQDLARQAMDIATASGKPLETVVGALEKAYGGNLTALGKLAPEYRDMIKDGASFEEVMAELAKTTGGAASEAANTAEGQFKRLGVALAETKESVGAALLPAVEAVLPILTSLGNWAQEHPQAFVAIAAAIGGIALAITAVNIAMALNPFTLIAAGLAVLGAGAIYAFNKFQVFRDGVEMIINNVIRSINALIRVMNLLPGVNIKTISHVNFGKIGDGGPTGADISKYQGIPAMANGGIVNSPTLAMIGEAGPEAVIPLDRLGSMGGGSNVIINVNGGDPQQVVNALRRYMQVNGSVPIRVSA